MDDVWVPVIAILVTIGLPISGWIIMRVLAHQERMAMLQRGIVPPPTGKAWRRMQRDGVAWTPPPWTAPGPPPQAPPQGYGYGYDPYAAQCLMRKGVITTMVGLALVIGLSVMLGYHEGPLGTEYFRPGPWLLGGLIPMFVGIAQIINALMSGAQFTYRAPGGPGPNMPPPAGPPPPTARPYGTAEPGRPGPRYEELARPVPPPDRL